MLYDCNIRHRWHGASNGAILADVYFQLVDDLVEISWNNEEPDEGIEFCAIQGGARIQEDTFYFIVNEFLKEYALHWFK